MPAENSVPATSKTGTQRMPEIVHAADAREREQHRNGNRNFMAHGSSRHIQLLGLRLADSEDDVTITASDGVRWAFADVTAFGPSVRTEYLIRVLRQKVGEVYAGPPPIPQSENPALPNYAPPMWNPDVVDADRHRIPSQDDVEKALDVLTRLGIRAEVPSGVG